MPFPARLVSEALLRVRRLRVEFGRRPAVCGLDFDLYAGETLGLVGESGSGKSSVARAILCLIDAAGGSVQWRGEELLSCSPARLRELRRDMQIVFQNPAASLNPRMRAADAIAEPLRIFEPRMDEAARRAKIAAMLEQVGLNAGMGTRYPHELSGGQCQRVAVARAMILQPKLLVCDEPVSSLDVSIQGQIVNLLSDMQAQFGTAMLFISHNLGVVRHLSQRIMVLYLGRCVELAAREELFARPLHPYTQTLLAAASGKVAAGPPATGTPATGTPATGMQATGMQAADKPPAGCVYRERCSFAMDLCHTLDPPLVEIVPRRFAACHRAREFCDPAQVA
jgi:oligopeptide/dipeptide ABC transporter ATP-binding protein